MGMAVEDADAIAALATDKAIQQMLLSSAPMHRVVLTRSFYLSVHEVTQSQFKTITGTNPSGFSPHGQGADMVKDEDTEVFPAENVSASDAEDFCNKLSLRDMRQPDGYRLPTEAEWEWACRAGTTTTWSHGNNASALPTFAWFGPPVSSRTHPVGQLISNPFGLFDMHGNVMEWCQDWHGQDYYKLLLPDVAVDPIGPETGFAKVVRGGNWSNFPLMHGSACRFKLIPTGSVNGIGFRVALSIPEIRDAVFGDSTKENSKSIEAEDTPQDVPTTEVSPASLHKEANL